MYYSVSGWGTGWPAIEIANEEYYWTRINFEIFKNVLESACFMLKKYIAF